MTTASTLRRKLVDRKEHVIQFTKADGTERVMRCVYQGGPIRGNVMPVFDLEKQEIRHVNLTRVHAHWTARPKQQKVTAERLEDNRRRMAEISAMFSY